MTLSYQWLCEYLPQRPEPAVLSDILTAVGLEVESMEKMETIRGGLQGLVVGKILQCEPHPNADKLKLTKVDIGQGEPLSIVCGAPNAASGLTVVVAPIGTTIYPIHGEPFTIRAAKIRGEASEGMLCAEDEIGLGESHDGLLLLDETYKTGSALRDYYQIPDADYIYEIGLTPNRMNAMSHIGVARDVCAYLANRSGEEMQVVLPAVQLPAAEPNASLPIQVHVEDESGCPRYAGICIRNVQVQESPVWIQQCLKKIGLRPVNNIVDITNFVLHECGQPLHAFDYNKIDGQQLFIRSAVEGTPFTTLDDKNKTLSADDLVIADAQQVLCIAGVMGGAYSAVHAGTTDLFIESACFNKERIRRSSTRHGIRSDAAVRFEKGSDISLVPFALQRATALILQYAGGQLASPMQDLYLHINPRTQVHVKPSYIRQLAGKDYPLTQLTTILRHLDFEITNATEDQLDLQVPYANPDISMPADVVEEIMRIDGLDEIPFTGRISYAIGQTNASREPALRNKLALWLSGKGLQEIFTNSITFSGYYPDMDGLVRMMNNLSAELDCMRPSMLETGLQVIAHNLNRKNTQLKLFEFGKIYRQGAEGFSETPQLCMYFSGQVLPAHYQVKTRPIDFFYVKGWVENLLFTFRTEWKEANGEWDVWVRGKKLGSVQHVPDARLKAFDIKQDVWFVALDWTTLSQLLLQDHITYQPVSKFPVVQRDLSLLLGRKQAYQDVEKAVYAAKSPLLKELQLFDVFEHDKLGPDKKSLAITLSFGHPEKTLTDTEVESEVQLIIQSLETRVQAIIRGPEA